MLENENLVVSETAENVEATTEEAPKIYSEAEFEAKLNEGFGKKIARREAKIRKEYDKKYGNLENVLKAGMGIDSIEEITDTLKKHYEGRGIQFESKPEYSAKDLDILARADAQDIIRAGDDEIAEEIERLTVLGADNMSAREKAMYKMLTSHKKDAQKQKELAEIGVNAEVYNSKGFQNFAKKFASDTPITEVYDFYNKTQNRKEFKTAGSMKSTAAEDDGIKDFYTPEEAKRFTVEDFNKNPKLYVQVLDSIKRWSK